MKHSEKEIRVWNRALGTGPIRLIGDLALSELLRLHGYIKNGGVLHGVEGFGSDDWEFALEGYRLFGLGDIADFLIDAKKRFQTTEDTGALESEANEHYYASVTNERLLGALRARLVSHPEDFDP